MTHEELERNWQKCVLKSFRGSMIPLAERYSRCLGPRGGIGVAFQIYGTNGESPDHFSVLRVEADGKCYDEGTTGYGMRVGTLVLIDTNLESLAE
jgi:hypothetical protein